MGHGAISWESLLETQAPAECFLKAALFTTYDRADERFVVEHLLPMFLRLGHEHDGEGAERQYFLLELDRRLQEIHDRIDPSLDGRQCTKSCATLKTLASPLGKRRRGHR